VYVNFENKPFKGEWQNRKSCMIGTIVVWQVDDTFKSTLMWMIIRIVHPTIWWQQFEKWLGYIPNDEILKAENEEITLPLRSRRSKSFIGAKIISDRWKMLGSKWLRLEFPQHSLWLSETCHLPCSQRQQATAIVAARQKNVKAQ